MNESTEKQDMKIILKEFIILAVLFIALAGLFLGRLDDFNLNTIKKTEAASVTLANPFQNIKLEARAAYVFDTKTGKPLFSQNAKEILPLASLTKIMTTVTAGESLPLAQTVTINKEALERDGDTGLLGGERWKLSDLLSFSLIVSSNDGVAAVALSGGATDSFIKQMNATAQKIGMENAFFLNESGLDVGPTQNGGYASAEGMEKLFQYALDKFGPILQNTASNNKDFISEDGFRHNAQNTNTIIGKIPGLIASKTGYTDIAGGNLVVAFDAGINDPIIAVVLGSSYAGRFEDMQKLTSATLELLTRKN